jgi:hypothetical protein
MSLQANVRRPRPAETKERGNTEGGMCEWRHPKRNENPLLWKGEKMADDGWMGTGQGGLSQGGARERESARGGCTGQQREIKEWAAKNSPKGSQGLPCT